MGMLECVSNMVIIIIIWESTHTKWKYKHFSVSSAVVFRLCSALVPIPIQHLEFRFNMLMSNKICMIWMVTEQPNRSWSKQIDLIQQQHTPTKYRSRHFISVLTSLRLFDGVCTLVCITMIVERSNMMWHREMSHIFLLLINFITSITVRFMQYCTCHSIEFSFYVIRKNTSHMNGQEFQRLKISEYWRKECLSMMAVCPV